MPKLGLVLISHGSPSAEWNAGMEAIAERVRQELQDSSIESPFEIVKLAHLEFVAPSIADVCDEFETAGIDRIFALPIFISISSHTGLDIPNALNIQYHVNSDPKIRRYLGKVPITLCPPLDHGSMLPEVIADAAAAISANPTMESAVLLSHGDGCEHFWNHLHRRVAHAVTAKTGIKEVSWAIVQTGRSDAAKQRYRETVQAALVNKERVLVLSCFTGLSGSQFLVRLARGEADPRIVGCKGWADHPALARQIAAVACVAARDCVSRDKNVESKETSDVMDEKEQPPYNPPFYLTRDRTIEGA